MVVFEDTGSLLDQKRKNNFQYIFLKAAYYPSVLILSALTLCRKFLADLRNPVSPEREEKREYYGSKFSWILTWAFIMVLHYFLPLLLHTQRPCFVSLVA